METVKMDTTQGNSVSAGRDYKENAVEFETTLTFALPCLQSNLVYNKLLYEVVISNLNIMKNNQLKLSSLTKLNLGESCIAACSKINNVQTEEEFSHILQFLATALEFLDVSQKFCLFESVFDGIMFKCEKMMNISSSDALLKVLRLIEVLLTSFTEDSEMIAKLPMDILSFFKELLPRILLLNKTSLITYSLSLFTLMSRFFPRTSLSYQIWLSISEKALQDENFTKTFLIILTYLLRSAVILEEKFRIVNSEQFWILVKRCLQEDSSYRKYALCILKYVIFNICVGNNPETDCEIWKRKDSKNYNFWWKTYFVITDSLDEKQTHLIMPTFSLMQNLANDQVVKLDIFWILNAIQHALQHDSRTVRIEAFMCLFSLKIDMKGENVNVLLKMICSMNDSALIRKIFKMKKFDTFRNHFSIWVTEFLSVNKNRFSVLLREVISQKWSLIPLYYFLRLISECDNGYELVKEEFAGEAMKNFIKNSASLQNVIIRTAVQKLFIGILIRRLKRDLETASVFLEILNYFNDEECLQRGSQIWSDIIDYMKKSIDLSSAERLVLKRLKTYVECNERTDTFSLARDVLLLEDAFHLFAKSRSVEEYFVTMTMSFKSSMSNAYFNVKVQDNYLQLLIHLHSRCSRTPEVTPVRQIIELRSVDMVAYMFQRMMKTDDQLLLNLYVSCLQNLNIDEACFHNREFVNLINKWLPLMREEFRQRDRPSAYPSLIILSWIYDSILSHSKTKQTEEWRSLITGKMAEYVIINKEQSFILLSDSVEHTKAASNYMNTFWKLFGPCAGDLYQYWTELKFTYIIFDVIFESFELARPENLPSIFRFLGHISANKNFLQEEHVGKIIDQSWKRLMEIQSTPHYSVAAKYWIQAFVRKPLFQSMFQKKVKHYMDELLKKADEDGGQSYKNIAIILDELVKIEDELVKIGTFYISNCEVVDFLINVFCSAHMIRKDLRIEYDTVDLIHSSQAEGLTSQILESDFVHLSEKVRLRALNLLLDICQKKSSSVFTCMRIIKLLTSPDDSGKKRYFGDSLIHRRKHRKLQLLLIFETILYQKKFVLHPRHKEKCFKNIDDHVIHTLLVEPHQPSVRYMLEWLLVRRILHSPEYALDEFWISFSKETEKRIGSVCSFISVAYHLANVLKDEKIIDKAVQFTLPWAMAQHFNARLYAQTVLVKLINLNSKIKAKFQVLEDGLNSCLKRGNAVKNAVKLKEDFYFSHFHPVNHFTLQVILWDLPRLSNICCDEWISVESCDKYLSPDCGIPIQYANNSLTEFESSSWVAKIDAALHLNDNEKEERSLNVNETQKKFIPIRDDVAEASKIDAVKQRSNLIVVASLVDRAPNLGGLTRTCEIFGVATLVVDNLEIVRNKEFKSLSITAEKHQPLIEVRHFNLFNYLKTVKEKGYCVIGVEQATNSKSLGEFSFPLNSVVVLGNEKEGIPADLLPVLDVCIEIPQCGFIRSLNVHVSGSLIIWEYVKQHLFSL